ncbi:MAG: TIGR04376 family protein [Cyanobacterium sp. T60_A2020_053]|nr:TIGR04376 family protein [Cyanobacterium sp. T60_A2020_053]
MGLFEDFSSFLESRLEEFLNNNPQLKLEVLRDELKQQERDTLKLIIDLQSQQKKAETDVIEIGKEIQKWHPRIAKAKGAGRLDLAKEAEEREINLLCQGKLAWEKMENAKAKIKESKQLLASIEQKQKEVNLKIKELKNTQQSNYSYSPFSSSDTIYNSYSTDSLDPLEEKFAQWEIDQELKTMKKN